MVTVNQQFFNQSNNRISAPDAETADLEKLTANSHNFSAILLPPALQPYNQCIANQRHDYQKYGVKLKNE